MVDTEDTRTRLPSFQTRLASSPSADEPHRDGKQARAKPLQRIGRHTYSSGLDLETKIFSPSGRGRSFFLTSLFIELIDPVGQFSKEHFAALVGVPHDGTAEEPHYSQESKGGPGGRLLSDHVRANVVYFG